MGYSSGFETGPLWDYRVKTFELEAMEARVMLSADGMAPPVMSAQPEPSVLEQVIVEELLDTSPESILSESLGEDLFEDVPSAPIDVVDVHESAANRGIAKQGSATQSL